MKKVICVLLCVLMLFPASFALVSAEAEYVNVALNCVSTASSEISEEHSAYYGNDGINDNVEYTYWRSADSDTMAWWQVDMGLPYQISRIEYQPRIECPWEEKINFEVRASNDKNFHTYEVLAVCGADFSQSVWSQIINPVERFRYVRLVKTDAKPFSVGEIGLYVDMDSVLYGNDTGKLVIQSQFATDEAGRYTLPVDIIGTEYEREVSLLCQLNLMRGYEDGTFLPGKKITRAEFAAVVSRVLRAEYNATEPTFSDVPKSHWAFQAIEAVSHYGLVNGVSQGKFAPSDYITATQAVTILVRMVGYGIRAEEMGGYPGGYRTVAGQLGFLAYSINGEAITRGEIAKMLLKSLETDMMQQTGFGEQMLVEIVKGETILKNYFGLQKARGVITANSKTALTSTEGVVNENYVVIDGIQYRCKNPRTESLLGYRVDYYYMPDSDTPQEIVALIASTQNNVLVISSENEPYWSGDKLYYYTDEEKEHTKNVTVPLTVDVIYNGGAFLKNYTKDELIPSDGIMTLIDNNADNQYDVLSIVSENTYTVKWASERNDAIYVKEAVGCVQFYPSTDDVTIYHYKTDAALTLSQLKEWDIISVAQSYNPSGKKIYTIKVSEDSVVGEVTQKDDEFIILDGENRYKLAPNIAMTDISLLDKGIFYLDYQGRIAAFDGDMKQSGEYGFLCGTMQSGGVDKEYKFKIYTAQGEFITPNASKKLKVDGQSFATNAEITTHLKLQTQDSSGAQVIKYILNSKGEVLSVDTVYQHPSLENDENLSLDYTASNSYYMNSNIVGMVFGRDKDTILMRVPQDISNEDEFEILSSGYLENSTTYSFEAFDGGKSRIAKLFLFRDSSSGGIAEGARMFVVDKITTIVDDKGEPKQCLYGLYKGEQVCYTEYQDGTIAAANLSQGDIIAISLDSANRLKAIEKKFYPGGKPAGASDYSISPDVPQAGGPYSRRYYGYGTVGYRDGVMIRIDLEVTAAINPAVTGTVYTEMLANLSHDTLKLYVYDSAENKVYLGTKDDVVDSDTAGLSAADKVFIYAKEGNIQDIIILR